MKELLLILIITFVLIFVILYHKENGYLFGFSDCGKNIAEKFGTSNDTKSFGRSPVNHSENDLVNHTEHESVSHPTNQLIPTQLQQRPQQEIPPENKMKYYLFEHDGKSGNDTVVTDTVGKITSDMVNHAGTQIAHHLKYAMDPLSPLGYFLNNSSSTSMESNPLQSHVSDTHIQTSSDLSSESGSGFGSESESESDFKSDKNTSYTMGHTLKPITNTNDKAPDVVAKTQFNESGEICQISEARCNADHCGSENLHPILDPTYNMREAAKQCLLLEDHLNNIKKRCYDCIRKHFLIVDGFLEEAVSLEQDNTMRDMYRNLYLQWVRIEKEYAKDSKNPMILDNISKRIRVFRKPLIEKYFDTVSQYDD